MEPRAEPEVVAEVTEHVEVLDEPEVQEVGGTSGGRAATGGAAELAAAGGGATTGVAVVVGEAEGVVSALEYQRLQEETRAAVDELRELRRWRDRAAAKDLPNNCFQSL